MRALSVRQPWAELIAGRIKTIELRSWRTDYRGPLLICSGGRRDTDPDASAYECGPLGVAACVVELVDVRALKRGDHVAACCHHRDIHDERFGWIIKGARRVRPRPIVGKLKLFLVPDRFIIPI